MQSLNEEEYLFIRIGEYVKDTEFRGDFINNHFMLGVFRKFCYIELNDNP